MTWLRMMRTDGVEDTKLVNLATNQEVLDCKAHDHMELIHKAAKKRALEDDVSNQQDKCRKLQVGERMTTPHPRNRRQRLGFTSATIPMYISVKNGYVVGQ